LKTNNLSQKKYHIEKIDILRGIAILSVFLFHCLYILFPNYEIATYNQKGFIDINNTADFLIHFSPFSFGWSGVELFFIISGFLIHYGYLNKNEILDVKDFYLKRFWRIVPPYILVLFFFCFSTNSAFYYLFNKDGLINLLSHTFLVHNFSTETIFKINSSFWSLAIEVQLYLLYPLVIIWRKRIGIHKLLFVSLIISLIIALLQGRLKIPFISTILSYWYVWIAGAYLAEIYFSQKSIFKNKGFIVFVFSYVCLILSKHTIYLSNLQIYFATLGWLSFFEWFLSSTREPITGNLVKFFTTLGICSYSFYLIHQPYLSAILQHFNITNFGNNEYLSFVNLLFKPIVAFVIFFLISYSLYYFMETKSIAIGAKIIAKRKERAKKVIEV